MASRSGDEPTYLAVSNVWALHDYVMQRGGWQPTPLIREAALESALIRPRMAAYYDQADIPHQAALLAVAISQAQAFEDGNERTAFAAMRAFLYLNGFDIACDSLEVAERLTKVAERGDLTSEEATRQFAEWFSDQVVLRG